MVTKEEFEQKAYEFEMYKEQLNNISSQLKELQYRLNEFNIILESLDALKNGKEDDEIIVPIGSAVYIKTKQVKKRSVLINIGNNIVVEKPIDKASDYVNSRIKEIKNYIDRLNRDAQFFTLKIQELEPQLKQMNEELKK